MNMKISKEARYAFLLMMYLCRSGKADISDAAANLRMDEELLERVANKLWEHSLLVQHPDGATDQVTYSINGFPTVEQVLLAFNLVNFLPSSQWDSYKNGEFEHRAFLLFVKETRAAVSPFLRKTFPRLVNDLVMAEAHVLANLDEDSGVQ